jgi:hypothetical protein
MYKGTFKNPKLEGREPEQADAFILSTAAVLTKTSWIHQLSRADSHWKV